MIPHFNNPTALLRALESVRGQTLKPSRVIVVDDASTTHESQVVLDELDADPSGDVEVMRFGRNRGPSAARNAGWDQLDTEFVAFLDADDTWDSRKLEVQIAAMRQESAHVSAHMCSVLSSNSAREVALPAWSSSLIHARNLLFRSTFSTPSVVVSANVVERFPEDMRHCEDLDLWIRLATKHGGILFLPLTLGHLHKPAFGASGLSADLAAMERGQRMALRRSRDRGDVSSAVYRLALLFGVLRYVRRGLINRFR